MADPARVLILGGTSEARRLAERLAGDPRFTVETSFAGVTRDPARPAGGFRQGGFGGADGLARYLKESAIDLLVDATHPFAENISRHAAEAADNAGCQRVAVRRPAWVPRPGDHWVDVADAADAAAKAPDLGTRGFLTIGRQEIGAFAGCTGLWFLIRLIDPPAAPIAAPPNEVVTGRGPFDRAAEAALLRAHRIDFVVSKNSGGRDTYAKIDAARDLSLPVLMIRRPPPPPGEVATSVAEAIDRIEARFS